MKGVKKSYIEILGYREGQKEREKKSVIERMKEKQERKQGRGRERESKIRKNR